MTSSPSEKQTLAEGDVHVWLTFPNSVTDPGLLSAYEALMSSDEGEKRRRYHFEKDRHTCLLTRALVRTVLSRYADVRPEAWVFEKNEYGRPDLAPRQCTVPLRFNLSHTDGLIACGVTLSRDIGVDVENLQRREEIVSIADRFFSSLEVRSLHRLPTAKQHERFFCYWTLKEAYIKARGMGLALPLDQFSFHLDDEEAIRISFEPGMKDEPSTWQFSLSRPSPTHLLAVGARKQPGRDLAIQIMQTVPLSA